MKNDDQTPLNPDGDSPKKPTSKYTDYDVEKKVVQAYLLTRLATATMTAIDLNIYRPNMCRHKKELEKKGLLVVVCVSKCRVTGFKAQYLTCSPEIIERLKSNGAI